jgi:hypothetical protein
MIFTRIKPLHIRSLLYVLIALLPFLLNSCGIVQSSSWVAFTDTLGLGSEVQPSGVLVTLRGDVDVSMTKAADPEWVPNKKLEYPYAGIMMMFRQSGKAMDLSAASGLTLEYRSTGKISLILSQKDIEAGEEYRLGLPAQEELAVVHFSWEDFQQPSWAHTPKVMDLKQIGGVMFINSSKVQSTAKLTIHKVSFPGWSDPDSLPSLIKGLVIEN